MILHLGSRDLAKKVMRDGWVVVEKWNGEEEIPPSVGRKKYMGTCRFVLLLGLVLKFRWDEKGDRVEPWCNIVNEAWVCYKNKKTYLFIYLFKLCNIAAMLASGICAIFCFVKLLSSEILGTVHLLYSLPPCNTNFCQSRGSSDLI